jgi:hypothetical protein
MLFYQRRDVGNIVFDPGIVADGQRDGFVTGYNRFSRR